MGRSRAVLLVSGVGVLIVAFAYAGGRHGTGWAPHALWIAAYWTGQAVVYLPVVARLLAARELRTAESFLLTMGLAVHQYLQKWCYSPEQLKFPDELQHWAATTLILDTGRLFQPNDALPPAVHFPGLAALGAAVSELTGLSVSDAALLAAGVAHLVLVGALFAVVLRAGGTPRQAGLTCAFYATALHYLFFDSMYLYQTAALPYLMICVWVFLRLRSAAPLPVVAVGLLAAGAVVVSHHVTAFLLVGTLALLAAADIVLARRWISAAPAVVAGALVGAWVLLVAPDVLDYLGAPAESALAAARGFLGSGSTTVSSGSGGTATVVQAAGLVALFALFVVFLRGRGTDPWRWTVIIGAAGYFGSSALRFLGDDGPELAGRASTFTYLPMAMLVAALLTAWAIRTRVIVGLSLAALLLVGARLGGWPPTYGLLPGPHLTAAYERSVDGYAVAAARWSRMVPGPGHRIAADTTGTNLTSTYGGQDPVREAAELYYSPTFTDDDRALIRDLALDHVWVDLRLAAQLPASGSYFEQDPRADTHTTPIPLTALTKFDAEAGLDRVLDAGEIRIYAVDAG